MIKTILSFLLMLSLTVTASAQTWLSQLRKASIIDSVVVATKDKAWADFLNMSSYHIYYHQPLEHSKPDGESFQLRATLVVRNGLKSTSRPMHCLIEGYGIQENLWDYPSYYAGNKCLHNDYFELAEHFKANALYLEHRYFNSSSPSRANVRLEYCNTAEAAADFHAIIEAVKKVFTGKYIMSGISKGGITTIAQHTYYPDDADLYVPYVAPLCNGIDDSAVMKYIKTYTWDNKLNGYVNTIQRKMLLNPVVYDYYLNWKREGNPSMTDEEIRQYFLRDVGIMDFEFHMNYTRQEMRDMFSNLDKKEAALISQGYNESYLVALMLWYSTFDPEKCWGWLENYNARMRGGMDVRPKDVGDRKIPVPFRVTDTDYEYYTPYFYQALCELGTYGFDFNCILEKKDRDKGDALNAEWSKVGSSLWLMPYLRGTTYDPTLRNRVIDDVKNTSKPIIFLYGGDDAWTGGALPDECYNDINTFKVLLPEQGHAACINAASAEDQARIWELLDNAMAGTLMTGIEDKQNDTRDGIIYNLQGQKVNVMQRGHIYIRDGKKIVY